MKLHTQS